jgi:anthranilate phosphoribosyltransferase
MPLLAGALAALGTTHALIVHGEPGMDEFSPLGSTRVLEVRGANQREWTVDPADYGMTGATAADLAGGSPLENAQIIRDVLGGKGSAAATAAVVLNAAAALYVAGRAATYADGIALARDGVASGIGLQALERLRAAYARGA